MKPMLASGYDPTKIRMPVFVQPKLDGLRATIKWDKQGNSLILTTRTGVIIERSVLPHIYDAAKADLPKEMVLDGELYHPDWSLQRIMGACMRQTANDDSAQIGFHFFDCFIRGQAKMTFGQRYSRLASWFPRLGSKLYRVTTHVVSSLAEIDTCYVDNIHRGNEGIIVRHSQCIYEQGKRSQHVMKRKSRQDDDFRIVGLNEGEGKYKNCLGAFELITDDNKKFTAGSGLTDLDRQAIWSDRATKNKGVAKIEFHRLSDDGIPLQPTVKAYELT